MSTNPPMDTLASRLQACANDPMWADHAEVPKTWLSEAARRLEAQSSGGWIVPSEINVALNASPAEVAELVAWLRGSNWDRKRETLATRAADLLEFVAAQQAEGEPSS